MEARTWDSSVRRRPAMESSSFSYTFFWRSAAVATVGVSEASLGTGPTALVGGRVRLGLAQLVLDLLVEMLLLLLEHEEMLAQVHNRLPCRVARARRALASEVAHPGSHGGAQGTTRGDLTFEVGFDMATGSPVVVATAFQTPSSPRTRFGAPEREERRLLSRQSALPLHNRRPSSAQSSLAPLFERVRRGRLRWVVLALLATAALVSYRSRSASQFEAAIAARESGFVDNQKEMIRPPSYPTTAISVPTPILKPPSVAVPPVVISIPASVVLGPYDIAVRPPPSPASRPPLDEKFLSYSPHSGYHNQRISLENALTIATILGRTLLLPPVWLGHAIPYISFDKLQRRLQMANKGGLEHCKTLGEGGTQDPIPRECEGFWDWTMVHWDFLVDLSEVKQLVPVRERWNLTQEWLEEDIGLAEDDIYDLKDETMYQYRFYDSKLDLEPLTKFERRIDLPQLALETANYRLLNLGTLFGTSRLHLADAGNADARTTFRRAMVFRNPLLDGITETIRDRLGGGGMYYGLHLRVGDGAFQADARKNMQEVWRRLCAEKMKLDEALCRSVEEGDFSKYELDRSGSKGKVLSKRANSQPQRPGAFHHAPIPPIPTVVTRQDSLLHPSLTCRGELHTHPSLLPFNAPLFIATDAKLPTSNPHLAVFFTAFPCTFILGDFGTRSAINSEPVEGLDRLAVLRDEEDKVPLAQFLYPQLDAQLAAHGRALLGTPQSTYSRFAVDVLHQVYQYVTFRPRSPARSKLTAPQRLGYYRTGLSCE